MNAAQQAEIQDIESKMADLQQRLEDLRNPPVEKWEPKAGSVYLNFCLGVGVSASSESGRIAGMEHQTSEAAEEHARDLKVYNWLWQFRQEHRKAGENERFQIARDGDRWTYFSRNANYPGCIMMSSRVSELAVEALNEGRLVLEGFDSNLPH